MYVLKHEDYFKQTPVKFLVYDEEDEGRMKADTIEEGVPAEDERIMISKKADTRLFKQFNGRVRMLKKSYGEYLILKKSMEEIIDRIKQRKKPNHMFLLL